MLNTEAIVLKSVDFRDHQKVVTLFTPEHGIISMFASNLSSKNLHKMTLCSPLTRASYILHKGNKDLYKMKDGTLIDGHFELRNSIEKLTAGLEMIKLIDSSQFPHKGVPALYQLLRSYLKELKSTKNCTALLISYCLKLLIHEGVYQEDLIEEPLSELAFIKQFDQLDRVETEPKNLKDILKLTHQLVK